MGNKKASDVENVRKKRKNHFRFISAFKQMHIGNGEWSWFVVFTRTSNVDLFDLVLLWGCLKLGEIILSEKTGVALSKMSGTFCFVWLGVGRWIVRQTLYHISPPPLPSSQLSLSLSLLLYNMGGVDFFDVLLDLCPHYETILLYHAR